MGIEISLLGPPRVVRDGSRMPFDTRKAMALLALLALSERPRSRDALCELLWPGHDPDRARGALRRTLSTLRKAVGEEWIEASGDSVVLRRGTDLDLDVARFRAEVTGSPDAEQLAGAAAAFGGDFLEGFSLRDSAEFDGWQAEQADALRRELGDVLARLVGLLAARGDFTAAIPHARRRLELDPLHEPAHQELIRLYASAGERAAALDQYRECVRTLSRELGVAPLDETAALYEQVSEGELGPPAAARPSARPSANAVAPAELPLVGRGAELRRLREAHGTVSPDGRLAVIEGEAGIGKTRLATELGYELTTAGARVLAARCHEDEAGLPYGPVVELLRRAMEQPGGWSTELPPVRLSDAAVLLPELASLAEDAPEIAPPTGPEARTRLMDGVVSVLEAAVGGEVPGTIVIDDIHAADAATLDLVAYLGRRLRGRALFVVLTWRSEDLAPGHRLRRLVGDLVREGGASTVALDRLEPAEVAELVGTGDEGLASRIHAESEGLPLFVSEYINALRTGDGAEALPGGSRDLLRARLAGLPGIALQVLGTAAVLGRSFGLDTVRATSGRGDEETVVALEQLVERGLVRELDAADPAYDFRHHKLRELVYEEIGFARRRLLHARAATALAADGEPAIVAHHLQLAGEEEAAAAAFLQAADRAETVHAHADALEHLEAALALGPSDSASLHERIGDTRTLVGDYAGALASYETAAAQAATEGLAPIEHKIGNVHLRRGDRDRAEARMRRALEFPGEEGLRARIHADLSMTLLEAGRPDDASRLAGDARALAEGAGDQRALAQAHNMLGVIARSEGELERAQAELEQSLRLAEELGDPQACVAALNNFALALRAAERLDEAVELTSRALELCQGYGDRHREAALHNNLADLHHAAGSEDESMAHLKRAVALFADIGTGEPERLPEVWKLVSW